MTADQAWVRSVCDFDGPDADSSKDWPRYRLGKISIAVPPEYRRGASSPYVLEFSRGTASLHVSLQRESRNYSYLRMNRPGQVMCEANYGGLQTQAYAWHGTGTYIAAARWERLNEPDERPTVAANITTTRLRDAVILRKALHTIAMVGDSVR